MLILCLFSLHKTIQKTKKLLFKHLSSETTGPIVDKFHMKSPCDRGTKVCSNGSGHMTKMGAMPIYGKKLKKSSPEPKSR